MTREEAISELQKAIDLIKQNGKDWLDERDIPILQMAINALELSDAIMQQLNCKMFHSCVEIPDTTDTINKQDTIDIILSVARGESDVRTVVDNAINSIKKMPSAQLEVAKDICVPNNDCISRQAAIDALKMDISIIPFAKAREYVREAIETIYNRLEELPSAQPYTDEEIQKMQEIEQAQIQKAFALGREDAQPEIIRCKNCGHFIRSNASNATVCNKHDGLPYTVDSTDFCCRGERKEDENYKQN